MGLSLLLAAVNWPASAQLLTETVLHSFHGAATLDGASVYADVLLGADGVLYGTTWGGGSGAGGTVFRMNTDGGGYVILYNFKNAPDGGSPFSGLVQGRDGALYGTTYSGGASDSGTIFTIRTDGSGYRILYSFTDSPDGAHPRAGLVQGQDGWLYGTTMYGGDSNLGTVFKIDTNGNGYMVLHSFISNFQDGYTPYAGLIQGRDGALYGTTSSGGTTLMGTIFRLSTDAGSYQVIYTFKSGTGYWPRGALIQGTDGALYGTTYSGGPTNGGGVVYCVGTNGLDYRVLHAFPGGADLWCKLTEASDGALYGTTEWGGDFNGGIAFRLSPDGSAYSVLRHFASSSGADGSHPIAGLTGRGGAMYGTTLSGGLWGAGTVYRLTLAPQLTISRTAAGPLVTVTGFSGQPCRLDATTDCGASWTPRTGLVLTNGTANFLETDSAAIPTRLYRAVIQ